MIFLLKISSTGTQEHNNNRNPVIQHNGYFAHCENILLAMIVDDRKFVRELGYGRIINK